MNFNKDIDVSKDTNSLISLTKDYFINSGFNLVSLDKNIIVFKRGSLLVNSFTFNPLKLKSIITISFQKNNKVIADFSIDTKYQYILTREVDIWKKFIDEYITVITD